MLTISTPVALTFASLLFAIVLALLKLSFSAGTTAQKVDTVVICVEGIQATLRNEISGRICANEQRVNDNDRRLSVVEAKCDERHPHASK